MASGWMPRIWASRTKAKSRSRSESGVVMVSTLPKTCERARCVSMISDA